MYAKTDVHTRTDAHTHTTDHSANCSEPMVHSMTSAVWEFTSAAIINNERSMHRGIILCIILLYRGSFISFQFTELFAKL